MAGRADRDAAVAAMKVRGRWSKAVPPRLSFPAGAPELPSFRLSDYPASTSLESSAKGRPRPASGSQTGPGRRSWAPGLLQLPHCFPSASPRRGKRPGIPRAHAGDPLSDLGPVRVPRGLRPTQSCSPQSSVPLPTACPLPPRVLELTQMSGSTPDCRRTKLQDEGKRSGAGSGEAGARLTC